MVNEELLRKLASNDLKLKTLDFSYQNINDNDFERICTSLIGNDQVYSLMANNTYITDRGAYKLMELLRVNKHIVRVEIARNKEISNQCINAFLEEFKERFYNHNGLCRLALNPHRTTQWLEERDTLTPEQFMKEYCEPQRPVIVRNAAINSRAFKTWTPNYFCEKAGSNKVKFAKHDFQKKEVEHYFDRVRSTKMKMSEAIATMENLEPQSELKQKFYVQQISLRNLPELQNDITLPEFSLGLLNSLEENDKPIPLLWFGQKDTHTPLHYDSSDNIFIQIYGEKRVLLYPPSDTAYLSPYHPKPKCIDSGTHQSKKHQSDVLDKFSEALNLASGFQAQVRPGDVVFIPTGWWHEIRAGDTSSISLNYWISKPRESIREVDKLIDCDEFISSKQKDKILLKCAVILLEKNMPNYIFAFRKTLFQLAVIFHATEVVQLLLKHPAIKPNTTNFLFPFPPLFLAIKFKYMDILELLLEHKETNIQEPFKNLGYTPLTLAAENGNLNILKRLITAGADPTVRDGLGRKAVDLAMLNNKINCVKFLETVSG